MGRRARTLILFAILIAVLTAGCSPASDAGTAAPKVATLETTPAGGGKSATTTASPEDGRPRERLDMTPAESERLYAPYLACLGDNGLKVKKGATYSTADKEKAAAACTSKLPLPPWEVDPNNPDAIAFGRKVVECLRAKGVKHVELSTDTDIIGPSFGDSSTDSADASRVMDLQAECQREVANT